MSHSEGPVARRLVLILAAAVVFRVVLNLLFFWVWGPHAVNHVELWLYYGVASGVNSTAKGAADPTSWLFQLLGLLFQGDGLFYAVGLLSILLSAVAASLIFLIGREVYGWRAGFYAGLLYAFMYQPLALSLVGFTHDHLLMPLGLAVLLLVVLAYKAEGRWRLLYSAVAFVLFYLGTKINIGIYVTAAVAAAYLSSRLLERHRRLTPYLMAALVSCVLLGGLCLLPMVVGMELGKLPQGRLGSADVVPVTAVGFWMKYNLLLAFVPWGILAAYRRRELVGLTFALVGFVFSLIMERGTRFSDIGVAFLVAYALVEWSSRSKGMFAAVCVAAVAVALWLQLPLGYEAFFFAAGAALALTVGFLRFDAARVLFLLCSIGGILASASIFADSGHIIPEAEYVLYSKTLRGFGAGGVLASWDRGFMIDELSGMKASSSPAHLDYMAHEALWMPQRQAYGLLRREGVDYVVFSTKHFNDILLNGLPYYLLEGGLVLTPKDLPPIGFSEHLTAFKLRYGGADPRYFKPVAVADDPASGETLTVFRLGGSDSGNGTIITVLAYNNEGENLTAKVDVGLETYAQGKKPKPVHGSSIDFIFAPGTYAMCLMRTSAGIATVGSFAMFAASLALRRSRRRKASKWGRFAAYSGALCLVCGSALYLLSSCCQVAGPQDVEQTAGFNVTHRVFEAGFRASNISEASFDVGDVGDIHNCSVSLDGGRPWGYVGEVTFKDLCGGIDEKAKILLVDSTASGLYGRMAVEDVREVDLRLAEGQEMTVDYSFQRRNPGHEYVVGFWKSSCVATVAEKSREPRPAGVEVVYVFCGRATDLRDYSKIT